MNTIIKSGDTTILLDSATMSDLRTVAPIFIMMGLVFIGAYLTPVILGKIGDWEHKGVEAE